MISGEFEITTGPKTDFVDVTDQVEELLAESGIDNGMCYVTHTHSTAGLITNSIADPATRLDLMEEIDRLIPTRVDFCHTYDTPRDASAHIKSMLTGRTIILRVRDGVLDKGGFLGILFCEFDGPRKRRVQVILMPADEHIVLKGEL